MSHQQSLAQTQFPKRRTIPPSRRTGAPKEELGPERYREAVPNSRVARWLFRVDAGTRTGLSLPVRPAVDRSWVLPLVHPGRGRNCSLPWTQSCDIPNVARVRGSRGLYRTQELHHLISLAVCRHRHRDHRRSGPWGCVAPCLEGRRGSLLQGAGAPSRRWGMPSEAREFSTEY